MPEWTRARFDGKHVDEPSVSRIPKLFFSEGYIEGVRSGAKLYYAIHENGKKIAIENKGGDEIIKLCKREIELLYALSNKWKIE